MQLTIRKSTDRGHARHGWLDSRHTFSFADYHDPAHMGFRSLRVINEDLVAPGAGFPTHPHRDMEIFSYVVAGALAHKDSMGNGRELKPGQIQLMGAGSGVLHSEFNPSPTEHAHFLQIWIKPEAIGLPPTYTEWHPGTPAGDGTKTLVISRDGRDGSASIRQDADVHLIRLQAGETTGHEVRPGRGIWLQVIKGTVTVNDVVLSPGDAASTTDPGALRLAAGAATEALLFDLK